MSKKKNPKKREIKTYQDGGWSPISYFLLQSKEFRRLSSYAKVLFIDLLSMYKGFNNGDLSIPWSKMRSEFGWKSKETLYKARDELIEKGFLEKTRQGGKNKCCLYALTPWWRDGCDDKLDASFAATSKPIGGWRDIEIAATLQIGQHAAPL